MKSKTREEKRKKKKTLLKSVENPVLLPNEISCAPSFSHGAYNRHVKVLLAQPYPVPFSVFGPLQRSPMPLALPQVSLLYSAIVFESSISLMHVQRAWDAERKVAYAGSQLQDKLVHRLQDFVGSVNVVVPGRSAVDSFRREESSLQRYMQSFHGGKRRGNGVEKCVEACHV